MISKKAQYRYAALAVVLLGLLLVSTQLFFIVSEGTQAVVTRFGRVSRDPVVEAGLKIKIPFVEKVNFFSTKILSWDGAPKLLPTSDDKRIFVDTTARWRISDAAKFYATLSSSPQAYAKLDNIIDSRVRTVIGRYPMDELVRSDNAILDTTDQILNPEDPLEEESYFVINPIENGRSRLAEEILAFSREEINKDTLGIELVDMVVRQVRYPENVAEKAHQRMASERQKRAALQRSAGEGAKAKWQGRLERERETIIAEAEAKAANIYRQAYSVDPEFYRFWRALDSYQRTLPGVDKIFATDMEYFNYLYQATPDGAN